MRLLVLVAKKHPFLTKVGLVTDLKMVSEIQLVDALNGRASSNQAHEIVAAMKQEIDYRRKGIEKKEDISLKIRHHRFSCKPTKQYKQYKI